MAITFDAPNKLILLDGTTLQSIRSIYSRWVDWVATSDNLKWLPAFTTIADPPNVPVYATLTNGWLVKPLAGSYTLTLNDGFLYTSAGGDPIAASGGVEPRIRYQNPVIAVGYDMSGGGGSESNLGSGQYSVTANIRSAGVPIRATVTILQAGLVVAWGVSDQTGAVTFALSSGNYTVNVTASGFASVVGQALTVSTSGSFTVSLTPQSVTAPAGAGLCAVTVSVRDETGPVPGAIVKANMDTQNSTVDGSLIALTVTTGVTDANGLCVLTLIRKDSFTAGGIYHITATSQFAERPLYDRRVYITNASEVTADKLVPA